MTNEEINNQLGILLRECKVCHEWKRMGEFHRQDNTIGGLAKKCRPCHMDKVRDYFKRNPQSKESKNAAQRKLHYKSKYGMTLEDKDKMLAKQGGACGCCGSAGSSDAWHIDHCHVTGKVREILCLNCNMSLGLLKDSVERIEMLANYLRKHSGQ